MKKMITDDQISYALRAAPKTLPLPLFKALVYCASTIHQAFDEKSPVPRGRSREACVLTSLAAFEFLVRAGFLTARVRAVEVVVRAFDTRPGQGHEIHSLGIGVPGAVEEPGRWNGHLVVEIEDHLVDLTLYQAQRPAWPDLPGMAIVPLLERGGEGEALAQISLSGRDYEGFVGWYPSADERWREGPDASDLRRRRRVVDSLYFGFVKAQERASASGTSE